MPWSTITRYSLHALFFGLAAGAVWLILRLIILRRPMDRRGRIHLLTVVYLAMVLEIIGLRLGLQPIRPLSQPPHLAPLQVTLNQWRHGPGAFVYHVCGNLLWFVPLGLLLPMLRPGCRWFHALAAGAALSVTVELLQYLLGTGMPDIDDVLLNASGAYLGWLGFWIFNRRRA